MVVVELVGALEAEAHLHQGVLLLGRLHVGKVDLPGAQLVYSVAGLVAAHKLTLGQDDLLLGPPTHPDLVFLVPDTRKVLS